MLARSKKAPKIHGQESLPRTCPALNSRRPICGRSGGEALEYRDGRRGVKGVLRCGCAHYSNIFEDLLGIVIHLATNAVRLFM